MGRAVRQRSVAIAVGIVLAWCPRVFALDPSLDVTQYAHTAWKVSEGFSKGVIFAIAQTPDGYLWLGTEFGLVRFDGARNVVWQPPAGERLPSNDVRSLRVARDGRLWIGTTAGLASWKGGHLTHYPELDGKIVESLLEDHEGTVWVGVSSPPIGRLCKIQSGNTQCYGEDGRFGSGVTALYEDRKGDLWAGGMTGLWRWQPGPPKLFPLPEPTLRINALVEHGGGLLIAQNNGITRLRDGKTEVYPLPPEFKPHEFLRDHNGGLWIGAAVDQGLLHVHEGRTDVFTRSDGLSGDAVSGLFEDREGNLWASTVDGLDRFRDFAVPTISVKEGLSSRGVSSILAARDGDVWLGTSDGLNRWHHGKITREIGARGLPDAEVDSLFQDDGGQIWVATQRGVGVLRSDRFVPISSVPGGIVYAMTGDNEGNVWVSHTDGLFRVVQLKVVERIPWANLERRNVATSLLRDPVRGGLWLGFREGGVAYFKSGQIRASYAGAEGLGEGRVNELRLGPRGALWAATQGGLSRIKDGQVATLTEKNGLPCDTVHWTMEDDDHFVWLYMSCGLVRIAKSELDAWVADPKRIVPTMVLDSSDGARSHSFTAGYSPRVTKSADGKLWFLPFGGVSVVDPRHLPFNNLPPPVHIEQIVADGKTYDVSNGTHLPPRVRNLTIDYTALSLVAPEKVRFRIKLEGQDEDWREVVNDREVQYSNLAPRNYRFRVTACNNSGVWNEEGASLEFVIPPAWYQSNWFRALCVLTFLAMLWTVYQLRVNALKRRQAVLERHRTEIRALNEQLIKAQEAERMRIAGDLHDGVLQQITSLSLRLGQMRRLVPPDSEAKTTVGALQQQLIQIGTDIRHISHELHPALLQEAGLPAALSAYCEEFSKVRGLPVSCETDASVEQLSPGAALCLYRIAQEALGNAAKYSEAKKVEVRLTRSDGSVCLFVSDDGIGSTPDQIAKSGGLGVINMRERVHQLHGTFVFDSEPGHGTRVTVTVPFRPAS